MILRVIETSGILNLPDGAARQLLSDAPGRYEIVAKGPDVAAWVKAMDVPPHDKMQRRDQTRGPNPPDPKSHPEMLVPLTAGEKRKTK